MSRILLLLSFFFLSPTLFAQEGDIIVTFKEEVACRVREVTNDLVKYSYPNEEVVYSMSLGQVKKIVFGSGRVQNFRSEPLIKTVRYVEDWKNVLVTKNEIEVQGLTKYNEISAAASYGTLQETRAKANQHLKQLAAMKGYKAVMKTFEEEEEIYSQYYHSHHLEALVSGIPYTDSIAPFSKFMSNVGSKTKFNVTRKYTLDKNGLNDLSSKTHFHFEKEEIKNGISYLHGKIGIHKGYFRLIYLGSSYFVLYHEDAWSHYNFVVNY